MQTRCRTLNAVHLTLLLLLTVTSPAATAAVPGGAGRLPGPPAVQVAAAGTGETVNDDAAAPEAVAVLPFTNISGNATDDWLGEGIAETVVADLEALGEFTVVARERVQAVVRGRGAQGATTPDNTAVTALGRELGTRWVVTGGYQRVGSQLRITARPGAGRDHSARGRPDEPRASRWSACRGPRWTG